ncbi:MAG TPA: hypothetical protein VGC06_26740 [Actinomycetes bacterium]
MSHKTPPPADARCTHRPPPSGSTQEAQRPRPVCRKPRTTAERQRLKSGPILYAGLGRLQLLAAPDSYQADRYDSATAAILYLAPGSLILLPPSRLADGQSVAWLRELDPNADLPDGAELFWTLIELPANQHLADPDMYTFPELQQTHRADSSR